jgi:hypothetical protein
MNDPKNIAAGILARGKASYEASGAKSPICSCARLGMYRCEAHGEANRRKEGEEHLAGMSVTELCAHHVGLRHDIALLERERDAALGRYADGVLEGDRLKAECAGLRALLSVARDSVEFEVQEKRQNWGDRLMHKQQGAIDLLAKITAAITPTPAAEQGGERP